LRWLPNAITIARLAGIPVVLWLIVGSDETIAPAAAWWFGAIAVTDFVDGNLARLLDAESRLGRILDPLADRLLMAAGLFGLLYLHRLPWPAPTIILVRDAVAIAAFIILARRGVEMRVDIWGKLSSALAMVGTGMCLLSTWVGGDVVFWLGVIISIATIANYGRTAARRLRLSGST
jgi:cardiolipin synthase